MPPAFLWAIGAIAAALGAKLLADAGKKANEDLDSLRREPKADDRAKIPTLKRDPETGQYHPPRS